MRYAIALVILAAIAAGIYYHYIAFDPLSLVTLVVLFVTQGRATDQRQQLANFMMKMHETNQSSQKELGRRIDLVRAEVKKK